MRTKSKYYQAILAGLLAILLAILLTNLAIAALIKLSDGPVSIYQISPNGEYVVFMKSDGLYSVPISGGTTVRLTEYLSPEQSIAGIEITTGQIYQISADSKQVVYRVSNGNYVEIYSVPIAGPASKSVKLGEAYEYDVMYGREEMIYEISADSSRVVYRANPDIVWIWNLYSVPISGPYSTSVKLNGALGDDGDVIDFLVSSNSSQVVYRASPESDEPADIYSVPISGPANDGFHLMVEGNCALDYQISPDSSRVIYKSDLDSIYGCELYSVPINGPDNVSVLLGKPNVSRGAIQTVKISADSSRVVYLADQEIDGVYELYSVPIVGPASLGIKLNKTLVADGDVREHFKISPDSSRVIYIADQEIDEVDDVFSVPIVGPASASVKLNRTLATTTSRVYAVKISADSSRVVYIAHTGELYSVTIAGPASTGVKINGILADNVSVSSYQISADSSRVVYKTGSIGDFVNEIYSVPIAGPDDKVVKLNGPFSATSSGVNGFLISPDSMHVVYVADHKVEYVFDLYVAFDPLIYLPLIIR